MCATRRSCAGTRGTTLAETLSYCVLFTVLLGAVYALFISSLRSYAATLATCEVGSRATTALARLSRELAEAAPTGIRVDGNPPGIVFGSPRDDAGGSTFTAGGSLEWHRVVCYYVDGEGRLMRAEEKLPSPAGTAPSVTAYPTSYFQHGGIMVASNVTSAAFTGTRPVAITLTIARTVGGRAASAVVSTQVVPRN